MESIPSYEQVVGVKQLSDGERAIELKRLLEYNAAENRLSIVGNRYIYHFMMDEICRTKPVQHESLWSVYHCDAEGGIERLAEECLRRRGSLRPQDIFETYRVNRGCVSIFQAGTAKHLYQRFGATSVLDPCAGWGGRLLAAHSLGLRYTGIDTNPHLMKPYSLILKDLNDPNLRMIWQSCLDTDFEAIDYDFVLTSPPYGNVELYTGMPEWPSKEAFYNAFLIPLLEKCLRSCRGRYVCFNISPAMYSDLLRCGFRPCDTMVDLPQRVRGGVDKQNKIYIWVKN